MADFKLLMWGHWTQLLEEISRAQLTLKRQYQLALAHLWMLMVFTASEGFGFGFQRGTARSSVLGMAELHHLDRASQHLSYQSMIIYWGQLKDLTGGTRTQSRISWSLKPRLMLTFKRESIPTMKKCKAHPLSPQKVQSGVTQPQDKERQGLPAATRSQERGVE